MPVGEEQAEAPAVRMVLLDEAQLLLLRLFLFPRFALALALADRAPVGGGGGGLDSRAGGFGARGGGWLVCRVNGGWDCGCEAGGAPPPEQDTLALIVCRTKRNASEKRVKFERRVAHSRHVTPDFRC